MSRAKVMIGCPVRNRAWILPEYLKALENLDYPHEYREYCFIINNSTDRTEQILQEFAVTSLSKVKLIVCNLEKPRGHRRGEYSFKHLSYLRNLLLEHFMNSDCLYLFSVDSDIIVPPNALATLIEDGYDIVSALVGNGHYLGDDQVFNILREQTPGRYVHIKEFPQNKPFPVDCTGAAYLIHRRVIKEYKVRYSAERGAEDIGFCEKARLQGIKVYCDPRVRCLHIMQEK
ncbi:glycosyltransferase [Thermosyntropha sp.]|uniref:glycosyltransferase n=1 Tax=Thermosyntropha sp. TaxID=2740820 RepID=UPI0025F5A2C9|nr:glycosyltransferase [Thermosyntropha sp.]MBO8159799.1 glycosyltransferase [Thermosyntropha sp.]